MAKATAEIEANHGLTTTEFWVSSLTPLIVALSEFTRTAPKDQYDAAVRVTAILSITAIVVSYNQSRGRTKSAISLARAAVANPSVSETKV